MKKHLLTLVGLVILCTISVNGQGYDWGFSLGSSNPDEAKKIITDSEGNVIIAGYFKDTMNVEPTTTDHYLYSKGEKDIFIVKYAADGQYLWSMSAGNTGNDYINDMDIDDEGNIYITGAFSGTVDFDPSMISWSATSKGERDVFIAKYTKEGHHQWVTSIGGTAYDEGKQISVSDESIYVTGYFSGTVDFDPTSGYENITADGTDMFIAKYELNRTYLWVKTINIASTDYLTDSEVDSSNNIYISGYFEDTIDFNPAAEVAEKHSYGGYDGFLLKLNEDGEYQWFRQYGNSQNDYAQSILIDGTDIYLAGDFQESLSFLVNIGGILKIITCTSHGGQDAILIKLNTGGTFSQFYSAGGANNDGFYDIAKDNEGNFYLTGKFGSDPVDFDFSSTGELKMGCNSSSTLDVFVASYSRDMSFRWVKDFGSSTFDYPRSISAFEDNQVFLALLSTGQVDMDPDKEINLSVNNGSSDAIIIKLRPYYTSAEIESFFALETNKMNFDTLNASIAMYFQDNMDLTNISAGYTLSEGATLKDTLPVDFSDSVLVTVVAEDTTITKNWNIVAFHLSDTLAKIIDFSIQNYQNHVVADQANRIIFVDMLESCDISSLSADIDISDGASITPDPGSPQDYTDTVYYNLVSKDGSMSYTWKVVVKDFVTTALKTNTLDEVSLYPNPATNKIIIDCKSEVISCVIYTTTGETVYNSNLTNGLNSINLDSLNKGVYIVRLTSGADNKIIKLIIR